MRRLSDAGFNEEDISAALGWLNEPVPPLGIVPRQHAFRFYSAEEQSFLDRDCRGFIEYLEQAGLMDAALREQVIAHCMASGRGSPDVQQLRVLVLSLLWQQSHQHSALLIHYFLGDETANKRFQ